MLKDLLQTLQQGVAQTEARRNEEAQALATMLVPALSAKSSGRSSHNNSSSPVGHIKGGSNLDKFLNAISQQESGGNYKAVGVPTSSGTAYGKYQVLDSNFVGPGGWDKQTLGRDITLQQYLHHPKLQEKMVRGILSNYFRQYGARGAAKAWYAGPGNANTNSNSPQYGGPSINAYAASVLKKMRGS